MSGGNRRSIRLPGYDYAQPNGYFITLCTFGRQHLVGEFIDGRLRLNELGEIGASEWLKTPTIHSEIELAEWVVMPNHFHAIVFIRWSPPPIIPCSGDRPVAPAPTAPPHAAGGRPNGPPPKSLGAMVGGFKAGATSAINAKRGTRGARIWQRDYYEHIIRDEWALSRIRAYIANNPAKWSYDRQNPHAAPQPSTVREEPQPWDV
ncbi:MAG TPA: transposase [Candidatus Ozemobacteraceae bacterium]|nr:transposase [Candidatus Ozemobacteraceae bacterium]